jgi:hypothetical protein
VQVSSDGAVMGRGGSVLCGGGGAGAQSRGVSPPHTGEPTDSPPGVRQAVPLEERMSDVRFLPRAKSHPLFKFRNSDLIDISIS